jgi:hypothetical protein
MRGAWPIGLSEGRINNLPSIPTWTYSATAVKICGKLRLGTCWAWLGRFACLFDVRLKAVPEPAGRYHCHRHARARLFALLTDIGEQKSRSSTVLDRLSKLHGQAKDSRPVLASAGCPKRGAARAGRRIAPWWNLTSTRRWIRGNQAALKNEGRSALDPPMQVHRMLWKADDITVAKRG